MGLSNLYARRAREVDASAIREICSLVSKREICSMAGGWPDQRTFPAKEIIDITATVLTEYPEKALQYGASEGVAAFREKLAKWTSERDGVPCTPDEILVTHGSAQGMELVAKVLLERGTSPSSGCLPTSAGPGRARPSARSS